MDSLLEVAEKYFPDLLIIVENKNESTENPGIVIEVELNAHNLGDALKDRSKFDEIYLSVSNDALKFYKLSEYRPRSITRIQFDKASLHFQQKRYGPAADILKQISIEYGWNLITTKVRLQLAECEHYLQNNEVFISAALGLLGPESPDEIRNEYQNRITEMAASGLSSVIMRDLYPLIDCRLKTITRPPYLVGNEITIECRLDSNLLNPMEFRKLSIIMVDSSSESFMHSTEAIHFTERSVTVNPGKNVFRLITPVSSTSILIHHFLIILV